MIITQAMTAEAEAAAVRYGAVVEGWRALYQRELDASDFGSSRQMGRITAQAYSIGRQYIDTEADEIAEVSERIAREAQGATLRDLKLPVASELTEAVTEHLSDSESYLLHELSIQIERDIAFLKQSLRKAALQVTIGARAQKIPIRAALMQYRIGNATELFFFFHDRRNQKWPSRKFVRAVWRHHLLSLYNETVLLTLADHGIDKAQVLHANPQANSHGMIVSMSSGTAMPTYSEIRNEIFHPNSDAILALVEE
jgi:hypothetical protein